MADDLVTPESLNEFMRTNRTVCEKLVAGIECRDGFIISVQGHYGAYSHPRTERADFYRQVECGFPNAPVPQLLQWKDWFGETQKVSDESDLQCVYAYVPVEVVAALLNDHGGIKGPSL